MSTLFGARFSIVTSTGTTVDGFATGPLSGGCSRGGFTNLFSSGGRPSAGYVATITTPDGRRFSDAGFAFASFVGGTPDGRNLVGESRLSFVSQLTEAQPIEAGAHLTLSETASAPSGASPLAETYTYTLRNDGSDTMFHVALSSDSCAPVTYQSGDSNGDALLQPGEDWTFSCSRTYTTAGTYTDHTQARATSAQTGLPTSSNTSVATVTPGGLPSTPARMTLSGRADPASGPTPLAVTFTYTLVNDGPETMHVAVGAPSSDPCSPITYQSGDTNGDALLEPGEMWTYTCSRTYTTDGIHTDHAQAGGISIQTGLSISSGAVQTTVHAGVTHVAPTFIVADPPTSATVGTPYGPYGFAASGNPSPTFSVATGTLPPGLTLEGNTLSGTPTTPGSYTFTVQATNGTSPDATTAPITITVAPAPAAPVLTASSPPASATAGTAYSYTFSATGNPAPTFTVATGAIPTGLTLSANGVLSGTPTATGSFTFTVRAANSVNPDAISSPLIITVASVEVSTRSGYWMLGSTGAVYSFGEAAQLGAATGIAAANIAPTPSGNGYWIVSQTGVVHTYGDATSFGGTPVLQAGEKVSSLSPTPTGTGYWLFTNRGRALPYGTARFFGDVSDIALNGPVIGSVPTPSGNGYYMVASDGGIFAFGDAVFAGSMGSQRLNGPVVGLASDPDGTGYWLVASDGGIFAFSSAFRGSMGGIPLNRPVVGMVAYGDGYLMVAADGGVFAFSTKPFRGSLGDNPPPNPIIAIAALNG